MKYGVISFSRGVANLGDYVQPLAVMEMYKRMGIAESDIVKVPFDEMSSYSGETVVLPISAWLGKRPNIDNFPISDHIIPVFFGTHTCDERIIEGIRNESIQFFGCRDEETYKWVKQSVNDDVRVFHSGCFTLLFERRKCSSTQNKVYIIDCPDEFRDYIPDDILKSATELQQIDISLFNMSNKEIAEKGFRFAQERLELLRDNAKLVITSRLHVALPCVAMGIPVIVAKSNGHETARFSGYEKLVHVYTPYEYEAVDWNPKTIDIEPLKNAIYNLASKLVRSSAQREKISFDEQLEKEISTIKSYISDETMFVNTGDTASYLTQAQKEHYWNNKEKYANIFEYIVGGSLKDKTLFVWGAGDKGYWMISRWDYILNEFKEVKFLDRNPKKCGKKFGGVDLTFEENPELIPELGLYDVVDPSVLKEYSKDDIYVIVAINKYFSNAGIAIEKDLRIEFGLTEGTNFFFLDKLDRSALMAIDSIALNKVQPM